MNIEYYRDGRAYSVETTLRNNRGGVALTRSGDDSDLGAKFSSLSEDTARRLQVRGGVSVNDIVADGKMASAAYARDLSSSVSTASV